LSPALDGLPHRKIEVIIFLSNDQADTTDHMGAFASTVAFDIKDIPPKTPVGVNAEESLAHRYENGKVEDGIWGQLPELDPVGEKKASEEFVGWKRKPTMQKSGKHNNETLWGLRARSKTWMNKV
jgi:hypothetical protein